MLLYALYLSDMNSDYRHLINLLSIKKGKLLKKIRILNYLYDKQKRISQIHYKKMKTLKNQNIVLQLRNREVKYAKKNPNEYKIYWNCKSTIYECHHLMDRTFIKQYDAIEKYKYAVRKINHFEKILAMLTIFQRVQSTALR